MRRACTTGLVTLCASALLGGCGRADHATTSAERQLALGSGEIISHPWTTGVAGGGPAPASNDWVRVEVAAYQLSETGNPGGYEFTWTFTLGLLHDAVNMVAVSDVTDETPQRLVAAGDGLFSDGKWLAQAESMPVSGFHLPWLFRDGESIRILRFSIADATGETRILYQPVHFTHDAKQRLLSITRSAR